MLAIKLLLLLAAMKQLLILLTGMNLYTACCLIRTRDILFSVGPTRSCWLIREPLLNSCRLTPQKTIHQTHQVTRAARLDIRREGWVISEKKYLASILVPNKK